MPEISGPGQKKLLQSEVHIYGETAKATAPLLYYLAAAGIGSILCFFEDNNGYETFFDSVRDLNNDVSIGLINKQSSILKRVRQTDNLGMTFRVCLGSFNFIYRFINSFIRSESENEFIPTILSVSNRWKGILQTFNNKGEINLFIKKLSEKVSFTRPDIYKISVVDFDAGIISTSMLGALCSIEGIKLCLDYGEIQEELLYFDIFTMEFNRIEYRKMDIFIEKLISGGSPDVSNSEIKNKLSKSKVLIVGTGGLGSPAALALTIAGVGTIGLIDYDTVEISNLNRQILHSTSRIGMRKVESAKLFLRNINPNINIVTYDSDFNKNNALEIIKDYDVVIDGVDNFPTRYLLNDACYLTRKPMIEAGVLRFDGLNTTIIPVEGHCYRCIQPDIPKGDSIPTCAESGVLGPVPGVMGLIQAAEAVKLIAGIGCILKNKLLFFDAQHMEFTLISLCKGTSCSLCGEHASINTLQEYKVICERESN